MMAGTPVVTTPVGAEGLDLVQGEHALIARRRGRPRRRHHAPAHRRRPLAPPGRRRRRPRRRAPRRRPRRAALRRDPRAGHGRRGRRRRPSRIRDGTDDATEHPPAHPDASAGRARSVLVASGGDEDLVDVRSHPCWPFPQGRDERLGRAPTRSTARRRSTTSTRNARVARATSCCRKPGVQLALPVPGAHRAPRRRVPAAAPGRAPRRLGPRARPPRPAAPRPAPAAQVLVFGTYAAHRTGPPPVLSPSSASSERSRSSSGGGPTPDAARPTTTSADADFVVYVRDDVILPARFLDRLDRDAGRRSDVDRLQPAHTERSRRRPADHRAPLRDRRPRGRRRHRRCPSSRCAAGAAPTGRRCSPTTSRSVCVGRCRSTARRRRLRPPDLGRSAPTAGRWRTCGPSRPSARGSAC